MPATLAPLAHGRLKLHIAGNYFCRQRGLSRDTCELIEEHYILSQCPKRGPLLVEAVLSSTLYHSPMMVACFKGDPRDNAESLGQLKLYQIALTRKQEIRTSHMFDFVGDPRFAKRTLLRSGRCWWYRMLIGVACSIAVENGGDARRRTVWEYTNFELAHSTTFFDKSDSDSD